MAKFKCAGFRRRNENGDPYCTFESPVRWLGACPECGRYYDIIKDRPQENVANMTLATLANIKPPERLSTGCKELDYVLGGGIVVGSTYVLTGPPGQGKCLAPETRLLLHTSNQRGRVVQNFQVKVGSQLLGPDGLPRTVLSVTKGRGPLRRIIPSKKSQGWSPWVCNDVHVLTLFDKKAHYLFDIALDEYLRVGGPQRADWLLVRISPETGRPFDVCTFRIEDAGIGDYFGFTLNGDGRFLLDDFTVTHNTTVLLQASQTIAESTKKPVLYTSGEQNADDVGIFAARLQIKSENIHIRGNEGDVYKITSEAERLKPALIVCDSIQTAFISDVGGDVGSAEQIKAVTNWLTSFGKVEKCSVIIVCHVTKDGSMAGPRVMEHLVDAICYLEPYGGLDDEDEDDEDDEYEERDQEFLGSLREFSIGKNRFGPPALRTVVQMTSRGIHTPERPVGDKIILAK